MGNYSREHCRRVSQPADTERDERDRLVRYIANDRAIADRIEMFPRLTPENANEAIAYQESRQIEHAKALMPLYPIGNRRAIRAA